MAESCSHGRKYLILNLYIKTVLSDQVKGYLAHFEQRDQKSWEVGKTAKQLISRKVLFRSEVFVTATFSNSLIIHEEKTKEITTVKEVWVCDPNYHKIRRSFALIFSKN